MSLYLADSTDLTSVASAIRTKGGTSAQLVFPNGFVSAVEAIPEAKNTWADSIARCTLVVNRGTLPAGNLVFDFPNATLGVSNFLLNAIAPNDNTEITINANRIVGSTTSASISSDIMALCASCQRITKITLNANQPIYAGSTFMTQSSVQRLLGTPITCTAFGGQTTSRRFANTNLVEFYLVPNKVTTGGVGIETGVLEDASLVSVANAIADGVTGQTLTISNATTKAKCDTIMGTVSQVTEDDVTYNFFTQSEDGTVSLASFITNTKGWTLA